MELKLINLLLCLTLINVHTCSETEKGETSPTGEHAEEGFEEITSDEEETERKETKKGGKHTTALRKIYRNIMLTEDSAASRGQEMYNKKNYEDALPFFKIAIKKGKTVSPSNYISRAKCYLKLDQRNKAILDFDMAAKQDPIYATGNQCLVIEALLEFEELSEVAIKEMCPSVNDLALVQMAYKLCSQEKYEQALRLYAEAFLGHENQEFYFSRATCHFKMGKLEDTRSDLERAFKAASYSAGDLPLTNFREIGLQGERLLLYGAWMNSKLSTEEFKEKLELSEQEVVKEGLQLYDQGKYPEALVLFHIATEKEGSASNYLFRGRCYAKMEKLEDAFLDFEEVVGQSNYEISFENQNLIIESIIDVDGFLQFVKRLDKVLGSTLVEFGQSLCANKQFERALRALDAAVSKVVCEEHYSARAICYVKMGKLDEARADWLKRESTRPYYKNLPYSDRIRRSLGLWKENESMVEDVLKSGLHNEDLKGKLLIEDEDFAQVGNELFDARKYNAALLFYNGAIGIKPLPEYFKKRGDCYSKLGYQNEALDEYKLANQIGQVLDKLSNTNVTSDEGTKSEREETQSP